MNVAVIPWWAWIAISGVLWFFRLVASAYSDRSVPENKRTSEWGLARAVLIIGMLLAFVVGIIRLVKSVWYP